MEIHGRLVDIHNEEIQSVKLLIENGTIAAITPNSHRAPFFIIPGFVDAHIHIESSMLPPSEFARLAIRHGTIATVSDPHEIANVLGLLGVEFMLENAAQVPLKFYFGAPSCVPATSFETSGAHIGAGEVKALLQKPTIKFLSEVMNYPGVLAGDTEVIQKITAAKECGKSIDGHAPDVHGEDLKKYVTAGIQTDHECTTLSEAKEKHALGMKILVREGSAACNFHTLFPLMREHPEDCMLCSDDLHPDNLILGHINLLVKRAIQNGMDLMDTLKCASLNPIEHYDLDVGLLRVGDRADFLLVEDLKNFRVIESYIDGRCVFKEEPLFPKITVYPINHFKTHRKEIDEFKIPHQDKKIKVIETIDKELITKKGVYVPTIMEGSVVSDPKRDLLKIAVVNRYEDKPLALGFVKNFGLQSGAIGSSVAHDSHNIVAVGVSDEDLCQCVNAIIASKGGLALTNQGQTDHLPLPIAGLMSNLDGIEVAHRYSNLDHLAKRLGSKLKSPFMSLSFMSLLVIPDLKISDKGLFDGTSFQLVSLFE